MKRVFVSHSTEDEELARRLANDLPRFGLRVMGSGKGIPGEDIAKSLRSEISKADAFIVLVTPALLRSRWPLRELELAYSRPRGRRRVIPVLGSKVEVASLPPLLQNLVYVDLTRDYEAGVASIARAVKSGGERDQEERAGGGRRESARWLQLVLSLAAAALTSIISAGTVMEISEYALPAMGVVGGLAALTAVLSSATRRRSKAPIEVVKRNVVSVFVNVLDDSELNPLRTETRHAESP